jgi:hypothetical protein
VVSIQCKFSNDAVVLDQEESASLAMEVIVSSSRIRSKLWGLEEFKFFGFELFLKVETFRPNVMMDLFSFIPFCCNHPPVCFLDIFALVTDNCELTILC